MCACSGVLCDAQAQRQPQPHVPCSRTRQAVSPPLWRDERALRLLECRRAAMRARGRPVRWQHVRTRSCFTDGECATHLRAGIDAAACRRGVALVALRGTRREARGVSGGEAPAAAEVSRRLRCAAHLDVVAALVLALGLLVEATTVRRAGALSLLRLCWRGVGHGARHAPTRPRSKGATRSNARRTLRAAATLAGYGR